MFCVGIVAETVMKRRENITKLTDSFYFEGKTRGAFSLPKGARNVFLNETEDSRNVLGESR